jgi:hypothetical protein
LGLTTKSLMMGSLCMECYGISALAGNEATTMGINDKTIDEKRKILLSKHNIHDVNDFTLAEVEELYEAIVLDGLAERDLTKQIRFPLKPTSFFDAEPVSYFDFNDGGGFLLDDKLTNQKVASVIQILAQLVTYSFLDDKTKKKNERAIPDLLADISRGCRLDGGERLMKRANRHSMDPRCPSVLSNTGAIRKIDGAVCLEIRGGMSASMKKDVYDTRVCITIDSLVACSCTCKAGSQGIERIACVHVPAKIQQFSHFCLDGFVEHALVELSVMWGTHCPLNNNQQLIQDISQLMSVVSPSKHSGLLAADTSVTKLLSNFSVGTEQGKRIPPPPSHDATYRPLDRYDFENPATKSLNLVRAKLELRKSSETGTERKSSETGTAKGSVSPKAFEPKYVCMQNAIDALMLFYTGREKNAMLEECLGFRLLRYRSIRERQQQLGSDTTETDWSPKTWKDLMILTDERLRPDSGANKGRKRTPPAAPHHRFSKRLRLQEPVARTRKRNCSHPCAIVTCDGSEKLGLGTHRVPPIPSTPPDDCTKATREAYHEALYLRKETLRRCGLKPNDSRKYL